MTKTSKKLDTNQATFDFDTPIEAYSRLRDEILNAPGPLCTVESYEETAIELASIVKATIRESGLSREQLVDANQQVFWLGNDGQKKMSHPGHAQ